jgi:beta-glucosidase-like glycosyl hydrolase
MPIPMALAAMFDPRPAYRYGDLVGNEVKAKGNDVVFAPTVNSVVDERTLREIYLPQFEAAVKEAHVGSIMCSYNRLNASTRARTSTC